MPKKKKSSIIPKIFDWLGEKAHNITGKRKPIVREFLNSKIKKTAKSSLIKLIISILAVYLAVIKPIGDQASLWVSSLLFISVLLWSFIDTIRFIIFFYRLPLLIIEKCDLSSGITEFIQEKWPTPTGVYGIFRLFGPRFSSKCRNLPSLNEMVRDLVSYFAKEVVLLVVFFSLYTYVVYYFFRPLILEKFAGLTTMQIYLFPITQISQELGW